jgi:hypothetical protein
MPQSKLAFYFQGLRLIDFNQKKMEVGMEDNTFTLEVLDPRGALAHPEVVGLSTPRPDGLNGKRIALLAEKPDSVKFFNRIETLLKQAYPAAAILRFDSPAKPTRPDNTDEVAMACDVWLQGVKTSTASRIDYDIKMEKLGKPGVTFCVDGLLRQRKSQAEINGMPTIRILALPSKQYFKAKADQELMDVVADAFFDEIILALTAPLTQTEQAPKPFGYDYSPKQFTGLSYTEANEKYQQYCSDRFLNDGLPVVPPTREAVDAMLAGTSRLPGEEIGVMYPREGIATVEKVAVNAVMAGAKPEYFPVILAAVDCITDKNFNQYHIVTGPMPMYWISGPIIDELGLNNDIAYLSPGYRANSTIGRAVSLSLINIGWRLMDVYAMPGGPGTPAAYTNYLIPENQDESPWLSFAVDSGCGAGESTVSASEMLWLSYGPSETLNYDSFEGNMQRMADILEPALYPAGITNNRSEWNRHIIVMHPTFASQLADAGFTKQSFAQWLYDKTAIVWDDLDETERARLKEKAASGRWFEFKVEDCKPGLVLAPFSDPENVAIIVSGSATGGTLVFTTNRGSTAKMGDNAPDFVPRPFMTKTIHGATLTKAGK